MLMGHCSTNGLGSSLIVTIAQGWQFLLGRIQFRRKDEIIKFFHIVNVKRGLAFGFEEDSVNLKDK